MLLHLYPWLNNQVITNRRLITNRLHLYPRLNNQVVTNRRVITNRLKRQRYPPLPDALSPQRRL